MPACGSTTAAPSARTCRRVDSQGRETDDDHPRPGNAVHLERVVAAPRRHREAHRRRPDDAARELRAVQPGRADRRVQPVPPRRHAGRRPPHSIRRPAATRRIVSVVDPEDQPAARSARRARRTPTSTRSASIARSARRLAVAIAYVRKRRRQLHRLDRRRRSVSRGDAARCPTAARCRCSCSSTRTAARRFLLTNPDGYSLTYNGLVMVVEKRRVERLAGVRLVHVVEGLRAAGVERDDRRGRAGQHRRAGAPEPARSGAIRTISPTRAGGCRTIGRTCSAPWAASTCRGPASWSPPICRYFSGKPWAATAQVSLPQGDQRILLEPRGSRRLSSQSLLDLRVSRTIRVRRRGTHRAAAGRAQRAQRHRGREPGDRQSVQHEFRSADVLHRSAPRDGRREAEPGPVNGRDAISADRSGRYRSFRASDRRRCDFPSGVMSNVRKAPCCCSA